MTMIAITHADIVGDDGLYDTRGRTGCQRNGLNGIYVFHCPDCWKNGCKCTCNIDPCNGIDRDCHWLHKQ